MVVICKHKATGSGMGCIFDGRLVSTGQRSFSFHGPTVWNSQLPSALRDDSLSLNTFSRQLKAYLFHTTRRRCGVL